MTGSTANRRRRPVALDFSANRPRPRRRRLVTAELFSPPCRSVTGRGNLLPDGYLAALAIEHAATWVTCDHGFTRFPGLRWQAPLPAEVSQPSSKRERSESSTACSWTARRFAAWSASARRIAFGRLLGLGVLAAQGPGGSHDTGRDDAMTSHLRNGETPSATAGGSPLQEVTCQVIYGHVQRGPDGVSGATPH